MSRDQITQTRRAWRASLVSLVSITSVMVLPAAGAVHDAGYFELDGNALANDGPGDDWSTLFPANTSLTVFNASWVAEPESNDTTYFSVSSKDIHDISTWSVSGSSAPPKDEIVNAFAAAYNSTSEGMILYFGADRWSNNGDAAVGFWFLQGNLSVAANGSVLGSHVDNDTLVVSHFTNGGAVATIYVYKWSWSAADHLVLIASGADCSLVGAGDLACGKVNGAPVASAVPYQGSGPKDLPGQYPRHSFFEGGIDLLALYGGNPPCFSNFLAETRSSQETTATLKDVAFHAFHNCPVVPPQSAITVEKLPLATPVYLGGTIGFRMTVLNSGPDPAVDLVLWDDLPPVSGTWTLGSAGDEADCTITGDNLTCDFGTVAVENGSGIGTRVIEVTAGTASLGDCGEQPNTVRITANDGLANDESSALVYVLCSDVGVVKTALDAEVDLGDDVGFTLLVTSYGPDAADDVTLEDPLPPVAGAYSLSGDNASGCGVASDLLTCSFGSIPVGATRTVTVSAPTSGEGDCGAHDNLATVRARVDTDPTNNESSASVNVLCSDVDVGKDPAAASVYLGTNVTFTLTVTSNGPDTATNVTLTDPLPDPPGGWELVTYDGACAITAGTLECDLGDIPSGEDRLVTVTAATGDASDCGLIENTARVSADLDLDGGNNEASAGTTVLCSSVSVLKTAAAASVDVGDNVTFTIRVSSDGPDAANGVTLDDTLPALTGPWQFVPGDDEADCSLVGLALSCAFGTLAAGATRNVTLTAETGVGDCGAVENTATVSADVDTTAGDNVALAFSYVTCADVSVEKVAGATSVNAGVNATWTVTIRSLGPDAATGITVADILSNGSILELGGNASAYCGVTGATATCSIPSLAAGSWLVLSITSSTAIAECGTIGNRVSVGADIDTNGSNNESIASLVVLCPGNATRTMGFWSTHTAYTQRVFDDALGGTMIVGTGGHTRTIDTDGKLFGIYFSSVSYETTGARRTPVEQARIVLGQQLVTAKLNCGAFGCNATVLAQISAADAAYAGNSKAAMAASTAILDAYNNGGDSVELPSTYGAWNPATPEISAAIADRAFWDDP